MRTIALFLLAGGVVVAQDRGRRPEQGAGIEVGEEAVDFRLKKLKQDPKEKDEFVELSSFRGKQSVLLIFGSYT